MAKRLLLADDSVTIQKVVELAFLEEDFEVIAFATGDEALGSLEESDAEILVCDIHMPGSDGYEICQRAKATRQGLPVLLLVGTFEAFDDDRYESSGADGYLRKPFDSQELVRKVKQLATESPEPAEATSVASADAEDGAFVQTFEAIDPMRAAVEETPSEALGTSIESGIPDVLLPPHGLAEEHEEEQQEPAIFDTLASERVVAEPADLAGPTERLPTLEAESTGLEEAAAPPPPPPPPAVEPAAASAESAVVPTPSEALEATPVADELPAAPAAEPAAAAAPGSLSDEDVERIARRVAELLGESAIREIAWEVVPDLAEVVVKERLDDLERQVEEL